ncbi:hypothetical protein H4Q26_000491 [Puccinia striiformis f. sp. tritici PST-130]|nr:hypothetical protein H4Q26_000491 [Puccinia striiformis f. sp. tritici PST-130]
MRIKAVLARGGLAPRKLVVAQTAHRHRLDDQVAQSEPSASESISNSRPSPDDTAPSSDDSAHSPDNRSDQHQSIEDTPHDDLALAAVTHSLSLSRITRGTAQNPYNPSQTAYNSSQWMVSPFAETRGFSYAVLIATMIAVLQPNSNHSTTWLLRRQRDLIELTLCRGLKSTSKHRSLLETERTTLNSLASDVRRETLKVVITTDHLVEESDLPNEGAKSGQTGDVVTSDKGETTGTSDICGKPLFKLRGSVKTPIRQFAYHPSTTGLPPVDSTWRGRRTQSILDCHCSFVSTQSGRSCIRHSRVFNMGGV